MRRRLAALLTLVMAATLLPAATVIADTITPASSRLEVVYLDTGNGDTAVYRGGCGDVGIVDVNAGAHSDVLGLLDGWNARSRVRWIAASHMHADHIGGILPVAQATGAPVLHRGSPAYDTQTYRNLMAWVDDGHGQVIDVGDRFTLCDATFNVVSAAASSDENNRSLCLRITLGQFVKGSCGDAGASVENTLASTLGRLDVWKVSHHGSAASSSAQFVSAIRPEVAVLTTGRNSYGHPSPAVVARYTSAGTTLFQTANSTGAAVDGHITITAVPSGQFTVTSTGGRTYSSFTATAPSLEPPAAQPIGAACNGTTTGRFPDVTGGSHAGAIDCIGWWGVTQGVSGGRYNPSGTVTRDQMASFVARAIELTGGTLPTSPRNHFGDDTGNAHERAINQLAELGVVGGVGSGRYAPSRNVTRAQMATFLANAWQARTGTPLPAGPALFADVTGDTHEARINAVAAAGLTGGTGPASYDPAGDVTRAQMGTFLARFMAKLVADGHATHPPANPVPLPPPPPRPVPPPTQPSPAEPQPGCVDINRASVEDLQRIIHIGPVRAPDVVRLRPYARVQDLQRVSGIGPARIRDILAQGVACV